MDKRGMTEIGPVSQKNLSESVHDLHELSMSAGRKLYGLLGHLRGPVPESNGTEPHIPGVMGGVDLCLTNMRDVCVMINELEMVIGYKGESMPSKNALSR